MRLLTLWTQMRHVLPDAEGLVTGNDPAAVAEFLRRVAINERASGLDGRMASADELDRIADAVQAGDDIGVLLLVSHPDPLAANAFVRGGTP